MTFAPQAVRRCVAVSIVLLSSVLVAGEALGMLRPEPAPQARNLAEGSVQLTTDAGATALFDERGLVPGRVVTRCVAVSYLGDPVPSQLDLRVDASGPLARHLEMTVESGSGGGYGTCDGFRGDVRFRGTLAEFAAAHGQSGDGLAIGMANQDTATTTFRFRFTPRDDAAAQGLASTGAFTWSATAPEVVVADPPPPEPPPPDSTAPDPTPTEEPSPTAPAAPTVPDPAAAPATSSAPPAPAAQPPSREIADAAPAPVDPADPTDPGPSESIPTAPSQSEFDEAPVPASAAPPPANDGARSDAPQERPGWSQLRERLSATFTRIAEVLGDVAEVAGTVVLVVAEASRFPFLLLILVMIFLAVQDRIDKKDPKLALAPIGTEPDLSFEPPFSLKDPLR